MNFLKKAFLAVIVLCCIVLPVSGSGSQSRESQSVFPVGKLTVWMELHANLSPNYVNFGDSPFAQELQKRTGIEVEYLHPSTGAAREAFNLMVADGNFPDIIQYSFQGYSGGPEKAIDDGVIIPLNDIIDKWAPNLKKVFTDKPDWARQAKTDSGIYYAFPFFRGDERLLFSNGLMVRRDWLNELGISVPETLDDVHNILAAFRDKKGIPAPFSADRSILIGNNAFIYAFGQAFGFYVHEDGQIHYGVIEPNFRNYLTLMAQWYREGLIDQDIFSLNATVVGSKITTGQSGMSYGGLNNPMNTWNLAAKKTNPDFSLVMVPNPGIQKGVRTEYSLTGLIFAGAMGGISSTTRNQELAARYMDYGYSPEGQLFYNFGIEGVSYNMINGFPTYTDLVMNHPQGWPISQSLAAYAQAGMNGFFIQDWRYYEQYMNTPEGKESMETIFYPVSIKHTMPILTPTVAEGQDLSRIMNEINTYVEEMVTKYILGTENLNTFDNFIATVKRMGIERALEIRNAALARFLAR